MFYGKNGKNLETKKKRTKIFSVACTIIKARNRILSLVYVRDVQCEQQNRLEIMDGLFSSLCSQISLTLSPSLVLPYMDALSFGLQTTKEKNIKYRKYAFHAHTSGLYYDLFERRMFESS